MTGASGGERNCAGCGLPLSRYNPEDRCQSCLRSGGMPEQRPVRRRGRAPDYLPDEVLARPDFRDACAQHDFGTMFLIMHEYRDQGWTFSHIGRRCEMTPSNLRFYTHGGRRPDSVSVIERVSDGFHIPGGMLRIGRRPWEAESAREFTETFARMVRRFMAERGLSLRGLARVVHCDPSHLSRILNGHKPVTPHLAALIDTLGAEGEIKQAAAAAMADIAEAEKEKLSLKASRDQKLVEQLRRTFLAGGLATLTLPALGLDELKHITDAIVNARRYADADIVGYFKRQLDSCAVDDGKRGPRQSLPIALGLIAAIEMMATDAKPATRRDLLRVGAYAAEFAGWLYRDVCAPEFANYWRDRAVEWAQVSGDSTMQGYVLLKKSQAVWDERDALRMLTLAEAVQEGPWRLPARVRAEAAQQQARGHAMLDNNLALMESKLAEAQSLLAQHKANSGMEPAEIAAHYDEALFGLQMAICYCEANQPERSLELYGDWLSPATFSRRDYAYFLALKGQAHVIAQEPDRAAIAGLEAFSLARETESMRTVQELTRLAVQLGRWSNRESVRELRNSMLVDS